MSLNYNDLLRFERCKSCNNPLFRYIDFKTNKLDKMVCVKCDNIPLNEVINTSINKKVFNMNESVVVTPNNYVNTKLDKTKLYFKSSGQLVKNKYTQMQYNPNAEIELIDKIEEIQKNKTDKPTLEEIEKAAAANAVIQDKPLTLHKGKIVIDWSKIIGYEEIKHIIDAALNSEYKKKTHILLCGAPGTSKTVFLLTILESMQKQKINAHYLDATTLTSSGVIEYMFTHDMEYCLLDELDKLAKEHQATFLNTLETGLLQETKNKKIRSKNMKDCTFIITANYQEKILKPLFTRMMTLLIPEYTKEQFYKIGVQLLTQQYNKTKEIAYYIVDSIYRIYMEERHEKPNLRYARDVAILTNNDKSEIDPILKGISKYSKAYEE